MLHFLRTGYVRVSFLYLLVELSSMKRYPNGALTGTCSMVRGPDEKPEVERQGSECESMVVSSSSGFETSQFFATIDLCDPQEGSVLPDQWKGKSGTTCVSSNKCSCIYLYENRFSNKSKGEIKSLGTVLVKICIYFVVNLTQAHNFSQSYRAWK